MNPDIRFIQREVHHTAETKGFHDGDRSRAKALALIHSEVSEALEADRDGDEDQYAEELADIVIRVLDHAHSEDIELWYEIRKKNEKNQERDYRHGKRY